MILQKVCLVGVFATGKTCLVRRFVHAAFSDRYLSTVGVKVDRKPLTIDGVDLNLLLWDLEGRDHDRDISPSYLGGAHGVIYVADGTRADTVRQLGELAAVVRAAAGDVPSVVAVNKADLTDQWVVGPEDLDRLAGTSQVVRPTSAKTGEGVNELFEALGRALLARQGKRV